MEQIEINKTIKLSEHYTLGEMTKTSTGMMNIPSRVSIENMKRVCGWLEALRCRYNQRYVISRKEEGGKRKENTSAESSALRVTSSPPKLGGVRGGLNARFSFLSLGFCPFPPTKLQPFSNSLHPNSS